jgi:hypothetical protein
MQRKPLHQCRNKTGPLARFFLGLLSTNSSTALRNCTSRP